MLVRTHFDCYYVRKNDKTTTTGILFDPALVLFTYQAYRESTIVIFMVLLVAADASHCIILNNFKTCCYYCHVSIAITALLANLIASGPCVFIALCCERTSIIHALTQN